MSGSQFVCEVCLKVFNNKSSLRKHQSEEICSKSATFQKIDVEIPLIEDKIISVNNETCGKEFKKFSLFLDHQKIHTGEKPFKCIICQRGFIKKRYLEQHQVSHTGEKPFRCTICQQGFTRKFCLNRHQLLHKGEKSFKCGFCQKKFMRKDHLYLHQSSETCKTLISEKRMHEKIPFKCDSCGKEFEYFSVFQIHQWIHSGEKPFKCAICQRYFNRKYHLDRHKVSHKKEKHFKCAICQQNFTRKYHLDKHQEFRKGEELFKCNICQKVFCYKYSLTRHRKQHKNEKLHKFQTKDTVVHDKLNNHMQLKMTEKHCFSAILEDRNKINTFVLQKHKNDSTEYLHKDNNLEGTSVKNSENNNFEYTDQQENPVKNMHGSSSNKDQHNLWRPFF